MFHYDPDAKPGRSHFYLTVFAGLSMGLWMLLGDSVHPFGFGFGILLSSIIYLCLGLIILHSQGIRDRIFGVTQCPWCRKEVITIKDKLKAKPNLGGKHFAKCVACNQRLSLPISTVLHFFVLVMAPIAGIIIFRSFLGFFLTGWAAAIGYALYFGRYMEIRKG